MKSQENQAILSIHRLSTFDIGGSELTLMSLDRASKLFELDRDISITLW